MNRKWMNSLLNSSAEVNIHDKIRKSMESIIFGNNYDNMNIRCLIIDLVFKSESAYVYMWKLIRALAKSYNEMFSLESTIMNIWSIRSIGYIIGFDIDHFIPRIEINKCKSCGSYIHNVGLIKHMRVCHSIRKINLIQKKIIKPCITCNCLFHPKFKIYDFLPNKTSKRNNIDLCPFDSIKCACCQKNFKVFDYLIYHQMICETKCFICGEIILGTNSYIHYQKNHKEPIKRMYS